MARDPSQLESLIEWAERVGARVVITPPSVDFATEWSVQADVRNGFTVHRDSLEGALIWAVHLASAGRPWAPAHEWPDLVHQSARPVQEETA